MKKLMTLLLAAALMLVTFTATGPEAYADTEKHDLKIETTSNQTGAEYKAYKVMTATKIGDDLYSYTVDDEFSSAFPLTASDGTVYALNKNKEICIQTGTGSNATLSDPIASDGRAYDKTAYDSSTDAAKLAAALEKYVQNNPTSVSAEATITAGDSAELDAGLYLVLQSKVPDNQAKEGYVASKPMLVSITSSNVTITAKDDKIPLNKDITGLNEDTSQAVDENTAKVGDVVNYKVTSYIPTYGADVDWDTVHFELYDTFCTGISFNTDSLKVYTGVTEGDKTTELTTTASDAKNKYTDKTAKSATGFDIELTKEAIKAHQGEYVTLVYSGTINSSAVINSANGNENTVDLYYTTAPGQNNGHLRDKVTTYTFGLGVEKVDKATGERLDGAEFKLYFGDSTDESDLVKFTYDSTTDTYTVDKNGTVDTIKVDSKSKGAPKVKGLDEGTYTLQETKAPDKYSKVDNITVTITANKTADGKLDGTATISASVKTQKGSQDADNTTKVTSNGGNIDVSIYVEDTKGISLPETGSRSAMFLMMGGILLLVAGGIFITMSRRREVER